jgi:hypothetical protein
MERVVIAQVLIPPVLADLQDWHVGSFAANPAANGVVENHQVGKVFQSETRDTEVSRAAELAMN